MERIVADHAAAPAPDAATATALRLLQDSPAALARPPRSSTPMGFLHLSSFRPVTCLLRDAEQAARLSRSALRWMAFAATGTKSCDSNAASLGLLRSRAGGRMRLPRVALAGAEAGRLGTTCSGLPTGEGGGGGGGDSSSYHGKASMGRLIGEGEGEAS